VVASIVKGFRALLKVALTLELSGTPVAVLAGRTEFTVGALSVTITLVFPLMLLPGQPVKVDNTNKAISHLKDSADLFKIFMFISSKINPEKFSRS
jgi:hypothetical protein